MLIKVISKIKCTSMSFLLLIYYKLRNLCIKKSGLSPDSNVVVSLTTFHKRINTVYLTIESIFDQSLKPSKVILVLSKEEIDENTLPKSLLKLQKRGLDIKFVDYNLRSYKKLIYTYNNENSIITIDDDVFYPSWLIERLVKESLRHSNTVICTRGHFLIKQADDRLFS